MIATKRVVAATLGAGSAVLGAWLRLAAREIAWPDNYSYSGPRETTAWAIKEQAYADVGLTLMLFGLLVVLVVLTHWLWAPPSADRA